jgi:hypothetical protein
MGAELPELKGKAPSFVVWAVKDPDDGNLERIQIVKGWTKSGQIFETVYDVARANEGRAVGTAGYRANGAGTKGAGAVELKTVWTDQDFDPSLNAFYYARVIQVPTPR